LDDTIGLMKDTGRRMLRAGLRFLMRPKARFLMAFSPRVKKHALHARTIDDASGRAGPSVADDLGGEDGVMGSGGGVVPPVWPASRPAARAGTVTMPWR
jgi:hypothetical protein